MFSAIKNFWESVKSVIGEIGVAAGPAFGTKEKFSEWADKNSCSIEKLEFCSFFETGFSYWQVRTGSSCAKAVLVDKNRKRTGAYLMTAFGHDVKVRFVSPEKIKFTVPVEPL